MMFCPHCGAPTMMAPALRLRSHQFSKLHKEQQDRCLCAMDLEQLERTAIMLDEKLHDLIDQHFPGTTRKGLQQAIRDLPKGDPLRTEMNQRMSYLQRLKDRRKELTQKQADLPKDRKPTHNQDGSLTFSGILADYDAPRKPRKPL